MLDLRLRPIKERVLVGAARRLARVVGPGSLTLLALAITIGAGWAAAVGLTVVALVAWLIGRLLDGLDGPVARLRGSDSDLGGYHDVLGDTVGYVAVPLGVAFSVDTRAGWITLSVLLGTFWVNGMSWSYLAAILEKRNAGASTTGEMTSVTMRPALIEGTETIVIYSAYILFPHIAPWLFAAMAGLVAINVLQRLRWASRHVTSHP